MPAAVTATPSGGTAVTTAFNANATGLPANDAAEFDPDTYPTEPAIAYYFRFRKAGQDDLISPIFSPSAAGTAEWNSVILPAAGTWALSVRDASDDSQAATANVVAA